MIEGCDMNDEFFLNPTIEWFLSCDIRRTARPKTRLVLTPRTHPELVRWLLSQLEPGQVNGQTIPPSAIREAWELGLIVKEPDVPPLDSPFQCDLGDRLVHLVPERLVHAARALLRDRSLLTLNPSLTWQWGEQLPSELMARAEIGPGLWAHLDDFEPLNARPIAEARPILWVGQPNSRMQQPFWCSNEAVEQVLALQAQGTVGSLREDTLLLLLLAEIVIPRSESLWTSRAARFRLEQGFLELGPIVSPLQLAALRDHYRRLRRSGHFVLDEAQVRRMRDGVYCEGMCLLLQKGLAGAVGEAVGEPVLPSYTWLNRYRPGAALERHRDRPQCRWNVSFCVDAEKNDEVDWPLFFQLEGGTASSNLQLGDAVLYSGTETPHWRHALGSDEAISMAFFHYVPSDFVGSKR
jgi:hypothetical protein